MRGGATELVIKLCQIRQHRELVNHWTVKHVPGVEEGRDAELPLSHPERKLTVPNRISLVQGVVVDQVWPEPVDDGTEGETIPPGGGEVPDVDPGVAGGDLPGPELQPCQACEEHGGSVSTGTDH